jgi:hypothetical protein
VNKKCIFTKHKAIVGKIQIGVILVARTIVAVFDVFANAEKAAYEIRNKGLRTDNISIIAKNNGNKAYYRPNSVNGCISISENQSIRYMLSKRERISDGIITGGIYGGATGIIIGAAGMFLPGLGIAAAVSPISGLIFGLISGGILGGLLNFGIPSEQRKMYDSLVSNGNTIFSMMVDEERMESIISIIKENGALQIEKY